MSGWIKYHRRVLDHYLFQEDRVFSKFEAWTYILLSANHKQTRCILGNEVFQVNEGQLVTSQKKLMKKFRWGKTKLRTFLGILENDGMLKIETTSKRTTLTVVNYSDYQHSQTANKPQVNRKQTDTKPQTDTYKNEKNDKNNIVNDQLYSFFDFWDDYDKKIGKKKCLKKWNSLSEKTKLLIKNHVPKYVNTIKDKQYQQHPYTYLNSESWLDEDLPKVSNEEHPLERAKRLAIEKGDYKEVKG